MNEDQGKTTEGTAAAAPAEKQLANIVRGQMPVLLVYMIRFAEKGNKEADIAKKYGTTGGKVADIVKGRNFAYVTEDFKPTQEQKDAAVAWLKRVPDYDKVGADAAVVAVEKSGVASAEEAAAFLSNRTSSRKAAPKAAPAAGTEASKNTETKPTAAKGGKGESKPASKETVNSLLS